MFKTIKQWHDLSSKPPHFSLFFVLAFHRYTSIVERLCFININLTPLNTFSSVSVEKWKVVCLRFRTCKNSRSCHQRRSRAFDIAWDVIFSPIHVIFLSSWVIRLAFLFSSTEFCRAVWKCFNIYFFFMTLQRNPITPSAWRSWKRPSSTQRRFGKQQSLRMSSWSHWMVREMAKLSEKQNSSRSSINFADSVRPTHSGGELLTPPVIFHVPSLRLCGHLHDLCRWGGLFHFFCV